ncbi:unnamed protein product [Acanthoscelides obtectus]|uniref:Uncharacterized protein n=1 Tax=Acanthoscelides obtectus TaxID=200917 RepID=A0A9P0PI79_ACAOB|nr:unnamed protein product [Acanthoscelides obtectus]CAK1654844.1 hypothetical protein AOBTE_LOCUS18892 [Acanthoscelides obtectus]
MLIGCKSVNSLGSAIFGKGLTIAFFHIFGNNPSKIHVSIIFSKAFVQNGIHSFRSLIEKPSSPMAFDEILLIILIKLVSVYIVFVKID